jgi:hypothetical protein
MSNDVYKNQHGLRYEILKDFVIPIITPLILVVIGFWIGTRVDKHRIADAENQSKAAILREMMTTRNGPDVAFFTAVGERLIVHMRRYDKLCQEAREKGFAGKELQSYLLRQEAETKGLTGKDMQSYVDKDALFDEKAIYFFYGMFRVALVDFSATKGYVLYPRIWMEEAFDGLINHVVERLRGARECELGSFPEEQAALYRYFGASKATYHTSSERSNDSTPDLFEFNLILTEPPQSKVITDARHVEELQKGFRRFQARLRNGDIDFNHMTVTFESITGLDDYAFNTVFSGWYKQFDPDQPVNLSNFLGGPPRDFLPYPLLHSVDATEAEWNKERKEAWKLILENVPTDLKKN